MTAPSRVFVSEDGRCVIRQADFVDTLSCVAEAGGCNLVLTSPPYDDARTYGANVVWRFEDYQRLGDAIYGALVPGGTALVVLDSPVRKWRKGFGTERGFTPWKVMLDWAERVGFRVPDRLAYARFGVPGEYAGRFRNDWEPLLWFERPGGVAFFDKWAIAEKAIHGPIAGRNTRARRHDGKMVVRRASGRAAEEGLKHRGTLWHYGSTGSHDDPGLVETGHPARYSLRFAEDAVRCFCPPDGLVVDPFVGSGTSAVAALRHGRRFAGGDLLADERGVPWARLAFERATQQVPERPAASSDGHVQRRQGG